MKRNILLSVFLLFSSLLISGIIPFHQVPVNIQSGKPVKLVLEIRDGFDLTDRAICYYRNFGELAFQEAEMMKGTETEPQFAVTIPANFASGEGLEYYFSIIGKDGNEITLPENQAQTNPYRISFNAPLKYSEGFIRLSPDPTLSTDLKNPVIAISYFALKNDLDLNSVQLVVDGKPVNSAVKSDNMIVYKPKSVLPGKHSYYVSGKLKNGVKIKSEEWWLKVPEIQFEMPLNITGNASVNTYLSSLNADYLNEKDNELRSNFQLNFRGYHRWLHFHSKLYFSSLERRNKQPVNRYNFGIKVPHFEIIGGDYSPNFGSFSVSGKNVRGVYSRLFFNDFRLLTTYGSIQRDTKGAITDTTMTPGTFRRKTMAMRLEVGNLKSFQWGLNITKNKDDKNSLAKEYYLDVDGLALETPKDNLILGTDFRLAVADQRFVLGTEAAMSLFNDNILDGAISKASLESEYDTTLPFDPAKLENIFIINENMQPIKPGLSNLAYKAYLRAFFAGNMLNISYSAVGSAYNSLSANYLQNDARTFGFYDNLNLFGNSLSLNFGLKLISDNLYNEKDYTTSTTNYFGRIYYARENLPYFSLSFNSNSSGNDFKPNSTQTVDYSVDIKSANYSFGTGYEVKNISFAPTKFSLSFNNLASKDEAHDSFDLKKNNITLSARSKFADLPVSSIISYSLSMNNNFSPSDGIYLKSDYHSVYMKGILSILDDKIKPYVDFKYSLFGGDIDSQTLEIVNLGAGYHLDRSTFLSTNLGLKFYQNADTENSNYSKIIWRFRISRKF